MRSTSAVLLGALVASAASCDEVVPTSATPPPVAPPLVVRGARASDCRAFAAPADKLTLERALATDLVVPLTVTPVAATQSYYVTEKEGRLMRVVGTTSTVALDMRAAGLVILRDWEDGLLGFAPHPAFPATPYGFFKYTAPGGPTGMRVVVARIASTDGGATFDATTARELLAYPAEESHHHGGAARFGPDGMLYVPFGDGGMSYEGDRAQDLADIRGKMLRIDVDAAGADPYAVPSDNPFVATPGARGEIWALGFRNPFEWSFDRDGSLYLGDVGWNEQEEIDRVVRGGNYGWRVREGTRCVGKAPCGTAAMIDPLFEYSHREGFAVVGGRVYHGSKLPWLRGRYVFGDYITGQIWALTSGPGPRHAERIATAPGEVSHFAEDFDGELIVSAPATGLYRLVPNDAGASEPPSLLSATGCVDMASPSTPARGLVPYDVAMPLWSDGLDKARSFAIPEGKTIGLAANGGTTLLDLPRGSVAVKTFFHGGRPVETRLLVRHEDRGWQGYSYEWNDGATEATLLDDGKIKRLADLEWTYPSRSQCMTCHTAPAARVLGLSVEQLNGQASYADGHVANQIEELDRTGLLAKAPPPAHALPHFPQRAERGDDGAWARAYLHANCAHCHQPGGPGGGRGDLRLSAPLEGNLCAHQGQLDGATLRWIEPGAPERSLVLQRMSRTDGARMPPLGTTRRDELALERVRAWIAGLTTCSK